MASTTKKSDKAKASPTTSLGKDDYTERSNRTHGSLCSTESKPPEKCPSDEEQVKGDSPRQERSNRDEIHPTGLDGSEDVCRSTRLHTSDLSPSSTAATAGSSMHGLSAAQHLIGGASTTSSAPVTRLSTRRAASAAASRIAETIAPNSPPHTGTAGLTTITSTHIPPTNNEASTRHVSSPSTLEVSANSPVPSSTAAPRFWRGGKLVKRGGRNSSFSSRNTSTAINLPSSTHVAFPTNLHSDEARAALDRSDRVQGRTRTQRTRSSHLTAVNEGQVNSTPASASTSASQARIRVAQQVLQDGRYPLSDLYISGTPNSYTLTSHRDDDENFTTAILGRRSMENISNSMVPRVMTASAILQNAHSDYMQGYVLLFLMQELGGSDTDAFRVIRNVLEARGFTGAPSDELMRRRKLNAMQLLARGPPSRPVAQVRREFDQRPRTWAVPPLPIAEQLAQLAGQGIPTSQLTPRVPWTLTAADAAAVRHSSTTSSRRDTRSGRSAAPRQADSGADREASAGAPFEPSSPDSIYGLSSHEPWPTPSANSEANFDAGPSPSPGPFDIPSDALYNVVLDDLSARSGIYVSPTHSEMRRALHDWVGGEMLPRTPAALAERLSRAATPMLGEEGSPEPPSSVVRDGLRGLERLFGREGDTEEDLESVEEAVEDAVEEGAEGR
ncbi:hypothetical protein CAC42_3355 [Sphaceloma murrayae]|uniref:Uncharacterized protein n=1 Tax=Sphaceloma murrayae TaxID=2082308 RepID=A0A2K1R148_9PEZI|nr:hypothetical protein CAC42_3355 [Sphaceloma murrayae]